MRTRALPGHYKSHYCDRRPRDTIAQTRILSVRRRFIGATIFVRDVRDTRASYSEIVHVTDIVIVWSLGYNNVRTGAVP